MKAKKVSYINRELSWLKFNKRVLGEATDKSNPVFERMKFLSITASNLDEFFMVRIGYLRDQTRSKQKPKKDISGMKPNEQLNALYPELHKFVKSQYKVYASLEKPLSKAGLHFAPVSVATKEEEQQLRGFFTNSVRHHITPIPIANNMPFPLIQQKTINMLFSLKDKKGSNTMFTVQAPSSLPRIIPSPIIGKDGSRRIFLLEDVISYFSFDLFKGYDPTNLTFLGYYRILRNAEISLDRKSDIDFLIDMENTVQKRKWGEIVKLEYSDSMDPGSVKFLRKKLKVEETDLYPVNRLDLTFLMDCYNLSGFGKYKEKKFKPKNYKMPKGDKFFKYLDSHDFLVFHPYDTFDTVVKFLSYAANDPKTKEIYQTLYRVSDNSPIVKSLITAAKKGKKVTVMVELRARFDEENNIKWAKKLKKSGCKVVYGFDYLKTHSKMSIVVREESYVRSIYAHLGTGNYNDKTANLYTDFGLFTSNPDICAEAIRVFDMLQGKTQNRGFDTIRVAPHNMKESIIQMIRHEITNKKAGKDARIIMKCNAMSDKDIINALYEASEAGVRIELIVRGICCLIPGMKYSKNIKVISIVGTFLEHARVYYFYNDGEAKIYVGSADMMPRNLDHRVEVIFPIYDNGIKENITSILELQLSDNVKSRIMTSAGNYKKAKSSKKKIDSQKILMKK